MWVFDVWEFWFRMWGWLPPRREFVYMEFRKGEMIYAKPVPHRCSS